MDDGREPRSREPGVLQGRDRLFPRQRCSRWSAAPPGGGIRSEDEEVTYLDLCFGTHHPQFGYDANDTLWFSGGGPVLGWLNTKMFDQTGDIAKSQGWTAFVLDTNGNGKRDAYVEPDQPVDPPRTSAWPPASTP